MDYSKLDEIKFVKDIPLDTIVYFYEFRHWTAIFCNIDYNIQCSIDIEEDKRKEFKNFYTLEEILNFVNQFERYGLSDVQIYQINDEIKKKDDAPIIEDVPAI